MRLMIAMEQLKEDQVWICSRRWEPTGLSEHGYPEWPGKIKDVTTLSDKKAVCTFFFF